MARDWVKFSTSMLFHAETQELPGETFKVWVNLILLAGTLDDDGRVGPIANVAYALHISPDALSDHVAQMNGRIATDPEGALHVRDWHEWQTQSDRDRKRSQRSREVEDVTPCHDASRDVTKGHECPPRDEIRGDETRGDESQDSAADVPSDPPTTKPKRAATPPPNVTHPEIWDAVCTWLGLAADPRQLSAATAANMRRLTALYVKAEEGHDRVRADADSWYRDDWRGKQGQAPSVAQAQDWRARCRRNGHAPPGRGTESPEWRKDKPADPRCVKAMRVARIAGDAEALLDMADPALREATIDRLLAGVPDQEVAHAAAS